MLTRPMDIKPLDRGSPVPLYHQLREQIVAGLESGELPMGAALPPEEELVQIGHKTIIGYLKLIIKSFI